MAFDQIIKGTLLPKISLKELWDIDTSNLGTQPRLNTAPDRLPSSADSAGATKPFVKINSQIVTNIQYMTIDETGFIPTVSLTFIDDVGEFSGVYFPKTDLVMSLYLKSPNSKLKPIRIDFLINSVKTIPPKFTGKGTSLVKGTTYIVRGEMFIPKLYNNNIRSYPKTTSKEVLQKVCEGLDLGFAENINDPSDSMTWINYNQSSAEFIKQVAQHIYQDDDSFFSVFIDKYYYLNYLEVNEQLKIGDASKTFITETNALTIGLNSDLRDSPELAELEEETILNYLTTEYQYSKQPNFITELNIISEQGDILKKLGYQKSIFYYDHLISGEPREKFIDFFMEPLKTPERERNQFLIPNQEDLANSNTAKWMGIDYGNEHPQWNAARLLNSINLKELDKIKLKVRLNKINFQVSRGFTIPIYITVKQAEELFSSGTSETELDEVEELDPGQYTADSQLSGYYYVSGAKYHYDPASASGLYTELFLSRREWQPSKNIE
jgi:hypothetical protein